jgi:phospholipid/cholesterol/gamma-HCH transport system substrate-binding protein
MGTLRRAMVGAFVLGGTILFGAGLFLIGDRRLLFEPQFELSTAFGRVSGLEVGTQVRVAGFDAGEVLEIGIPSRPSEKFLVRMRLREDLRPLVRVDSVGTVQTDGIVGSAFIQIGGGTDDARMVEPGETIEGVDPIAFADLIEEGRETFRIVARQIVEMSDEISETIGPLTDTARTASDLLVDVGADVKAITETGARATEDVRLVMADTRGIVSDLRAGRGTIGQLLTDDSHYKRWVGIASEAEQTVANLRMATERGRTLIEGVSARDGAAQQIVQTLRDTLADTREVMSDLSEGTEALKRNFLFRGFFRDRGFFDLDAITREAYVSGALERGDRTALRIWIDAAGLFARAADGTEQLTEAGRRRLESAMADLVRYPRDSPLIVEGYADSTAGEAAYLISSDRALLVRDFVLSRFRRRVTLTGIMPMSERAIGSPRGDRWSGVALALFVRNDALREMGQP